MPQTYVLVKFSESRSGGEVCKGDKGPWASHEPEYIEVAVGDVVLYEEGASLDGDSVSVSFNPLEYVGKPVYIVHVSYTTGDTFGSSHGHPNFPAVCSTAEEAYKIKKSIEDGTYGKKGEYLPWVGYFEGLDGVEIVVRELKE